MQKYMRGKTIQIVVKSMLGSILMAVMTKKSKQEEQAFCQFVEDILNTGFSKTEGKPDNLLLLMCLP